MGLGDKFVQTILLSVKGDVKDAQKSLQGLVGSFTKVVAAVGSVAAAYKLAGDSLEVFSKRQVDRAASAKFDIDGLKTATRGLVSETKLLEVAAAAANGAFEVSQKELEGMLRGTIALKNQGNDLNKTLDAMTKLVVEGNADGLKPMGITIKEATGSAAALEAGLARLSKEGEGAFFAMRHSSDDFAASQVRLKDTFERVRESIGRLLIQLEPFFAKVADFAIFLAETSEKGFREAAANFSVAELERTTRREAEDLAASIGLSVEQWNKAVQDGTIGQKRNAFVIAQTTGTLQEVSQNIDKVLNGLQETRRRQEADMKLAKGGGPLRIKEITGEDDIVPPEAVQIPKLTQSIADIGSDLKLPDIGAGKMAEDVFKASEAFVFLNEAGLSAFDSLARGSMTLGEAIKKGIADALMASAYRLFATGLEELVTATALAAGIITAPASAPKFSSAAFAFASAATLAGIGTALGASLAPPRTSAAGAGAPAPAVSGLGGGGAAAAGNTTNIVLGNDFAGMSPGERRSRLRRSLEAADISFDSNASVVAG